MQGSIENVMHRLGEEVDESHFAVQVGVEPARSALKVR